MIEEEISAATPSFVAVTDNGVAARCASVNVPEIVTFSFETETAVLSLSLVL